VPRAVTVAGLFIGLTTLDLVNYVERFPAPDEKLQSDHCWIGAGGPAANAAATFAALGGQATLITGLGKGALGRLAGADLTAHGVDVIDVSTGGELAVSSVVVDARGRRTVVSLNARGLGVQPGAARLADLPAPDVVAVDGHYPRLAALVLGRPSMASAPAVLDPGNSKPHLPELMDRCGHIIASCGLDDAARADEILARLQVHRPVLAAVTAGADPITASFDGVVQRIDVPATRAVDTLGAGDVLHGAYAYYLSTGRPPPEALRAAGVVAARSCGHRGPRIRC
jgi:sugar/nucleoside kinase (ribokinase family)